MKHFQNSFRFLSEKQTHTAENKAVVVDLYFLWRDSNDMQENQPPPVYLTLLFIKA